MKKPKLSTIFAYAVTATAALISAWKGSLDWMGLAAVALIFKMPGASWIKSILGKKDA
jgi:hypothetical protein